jgi:hypothetical protein
VTRPCDGPRRTIRIDLPIEGADDPRTLRGALVAARASELGELQRRAGRLSLGYGSESTRESMDAETVRLRRRIELLDALIAALAAASDDATS